MNWFRRNKHRIEDECCEESLSAYLDCELSAEERATVERHLAKCEDCRSNLETLRQTVEWTRDCAPVRLPRVFTIPVETAAPKAVKARRPAWALPALQGATALVAVLFIFVVAGDLFLGGSAPRSMSQPQMVALQATAVMDQATTAQQVEVTQVVEYAVVAPTAAAEAVAQPAPAEPATAKAGPPEATPPPPSAPEELVMAAPEPTMAALEPTLVGEVGGMGGGPAEVTVTMEVMVAAEESPTSLAKEAATSTVTVTLALAAAMPSPTQPLTVEVLLTASMTAEQETVVVLTPTDAAVQAAYPTATAAVVNATAAAAPTRSLVNLATAVPEVETLAPAPMPMEATAGEADQHEAPEAGAEEASDRAAPTEAPAAPGEAPAALSAGPEPTAVAAALEAREAEQGARSDEEQGPVGTLRESMAPWFGLAEIVLGAAFVLLALATAVVMLRWQPR